MIRYTNLSEPSPQPHGRTRSVSVPSDCGASPGASYGIGIEARLKALEAENRALWAAVNKLRSANQTPASAKPECQAVPNGTDGTDGTDNSANTNSPWAAAGMSRRTYFRKKKAGELG